MRAFMHRGRHAIRATLMHLHRAPVTRRITRRINTFKEKKFTTFAAVYAGIVGGGYCLTYIAAHDRVPFTNRRRLNLVPVGIEKLLGESVLANAVREGPVLNPELDACAARVERIAAALRSGNPELLPSGLLDKLVVIDSPTVNAATLPGGHVVVYRGLVEAFPNDDMLATVLAHEYGHAAAHHVSEGLTDTATVLIPMFIVPAIVVASAMGSDSESIIDISKTIYTWTLSLPSSRTHEYEADRLGLQIMARARFDPRAAPKVYRHFKACSGKKNDFDLHSTHPDGEKRATRVEALLPEALPLFYTAFEESMEKH